MCLLKFFWNKNEKRKDEFEISKFSNFLSTFLSFVSHQCCMKTLAVLVIFVTFFCLFGNPSSESKFLDRETDQLFNVLRWFSIEANQPKPRTERLISKSNTDVQTIKPNNNSENKCNCEKKFNISLLFSIENQNSTCDWFSTQRGPHQRIVSYSFYGDWIKNKEVGRKYFSQIGERAKEVKLHYPG